MMSASEADRDLVYFTFNSIDTANKLKKLYEIITRANLNISQVYKMILDFSVSLKNASSSFTSSATSYLDNCSICQYFEEQIKSVTF